MSIRYVDEEAPSDAAAIRAVHLAAFPTDGEARLVDLLRANGHATLSLVMRRAVIGGNAPDVIGHVLFSPVTIERDGNVVARGLGLAPLAVLPAQQKAGMGSALARAGLAMCRMLAAAEGVTFCVVLGEHDYYSRFGFVRASERGIANEYGVDDEFMIVAFGELPEGGGVAKYGDEFRTL
jgi:putative acetyltransferase